MKQLQYKVLGVAFVFLLMSSVITSATSFSDTNSKYLDISTKINRLGIINGDSKITTILEMINESLLQEYLEILVGYGPRMTGTYGCQKSSEYIYINNSIKWDYRQDIKTGLLLETNIIPEYLKVKMLKEI